MERNQQKMNLINTNQQYKQLDEKFCNHPEHHFPSMMYIPPGQEVVHTCPGCGKKCKVVGVEGSYLEGY